MDIYGYHIGMNIQKIFRQISDLQERINFNKPFDVNLQKLIQDYLRIEWTYNSNALEGNTLTKGETTFFLREGLTSEGKPLKDFLEAKNHAAAIDVLYSVVKDNKKITEHFIKSLHQVLLQGIEYTNAKGADYHLVKKPLNIGKYKMRPNHVLTVSGNLHCYTEPEQVQIEMEKLIKWLNSSDAKNLDPIFRASVFHYRFVAIHPFDDGNGRLARLLMNLILISEGFPPCVIKNENRKKYLSELELVDRTGSFDSLVYFFATELFVTMKFIYKLITNKSSDIVLDYRLNKEQRQKLIIKIISKRNCSIGQILLEIPQIKRPTLKKDLQELFTKGIIKRKGVGKGVFYYKG